MTPIGGTRAPVLAYSFLIFVRLSASGLVVPAFVCLPIWSDLHIVSATAIPFTDLVGLLRSLRLFDRDCARTVVTTRPPPADARTSAEMVNNDSDIELLIGSSFTLELRANSWLGSLFGRVALASAMQRMEPKA